MGSLGHYMQETSRAGFRLRDFLHEGNGDIWLSALARGPRAFAEWVLIEEKAEGGDMLAMRAREDPRFLDGYSRVCEGAGLALYQENKRYHGGHGDKRRVQQNEDAVTSVSSACSVAFPRQNLKFITNR